MLQVERMQVTRLALRHFRNYNEQVLELTPGTHVFQGSNAQGKTALLEAIYLGGTARSFRTHRDADLVQWSQQSAGLGLELQRDSGRRRELRIDWQLQGSQCRRDIFLQEHPVRRLSEFLSELPLTLFTPDDLELVQGSPQERRGYLDLLLCKLYPAYLEALGRYQKILKQKNALLRQPHPTVEELASWDELLAQFGSLVTEYRERLCTQLGPWLERLYAELSGETRQLRVRYQASSTSDSQLFARHLASRNREELRLRKCLVGPHRDDIEFLLEGTEVRRFGSQGQRRTLALALRLAQAEMLESIGLERPVVLLDDCFSELDPDRQQRLLSWLEHVPQVLITTATPLDIPRDHRRYRVEAGAVEPC